jgi:hypothetical protein
MKAALVPQSAALFFILRSAFQVFGDTTAALSQIKNTLCYSYSSTGVSAQIKTDLGRGLISAQPNSD